MRIHYGNVSSEETGARGCMPNDRSVERQLDAALADHEAGRVDLAEAGYRAVLRQDPDEPDALNLLGVIAQERGDLTESVALISRALAIVPDFPEALTNLARAQRAAGNPVAAACAAKRAVELEAGLAEAHLQLGHALIDLGNNAAAAYGLEQAAKLAPGSADAFRQLGVARLRLKTTRLRSMHFRWRCNLIQTGSTRW